MILLQFILAGSFYFSNATTYDVKLNSLREGMHVLVNEKGRITMVTQQPIPVDDGTTEIKDALVLPQLSDFYSLIQDRGLGYDENLDEAIQDRMAAYYKKVGIGAVRDPIFPRFGLNDSLRADLKVYAQKGYLEVKGGPSRNFSTVVDPEEPTVSVPKDGPITFWWTAMGSDEPVLWHQHPQLVRDLIQRFRKEGHTVGCYIQDARSEDVEKAHQFDFDFYEGMPGGTYDVGAFPEKVVWVPLITLNDKRYCAHKIDVRLRKRGLLGLFSPEETIRATEMMDSVSYRIRERCGVWQKRRVFAMGPVKRWLSEQRPFAVGSAGGHLFALSGDIKSECEAFESLGATQTQLMEAVFEHTPRLLGVNEAFLKVGQPANFIAYKKHGYWLKSLGKRVSHHFVDGKML